MTNHTDIFNAAPCPEGTQDMTQWRTVHNATVAAFRRGTGRRSERAILALLQGIDDHLGALDADPDPYMCEHVTGPLLSAAAAYLDYDLGRLDAGTLSAWVRSQYVRAGIDPDTERRYPYALQRDGAEISRHATELDAVGALHKLCPASASHAITHEGYAIVAR